MYSPVNIECSSCGNLMEITAFKQAEILARIQANSDYEMLTCKCGDQLILKARRKFEATRDIKK